MSRKDENKSNNPWYRISEANKSKLDETVQSNETEMESEERLANIFKRLDRNGNGRIDIQELTTALKGFGISQQYAEV